MAADINLEPYELNIEFRQGERLAMLMWFKDAAGAYIDPAATWDSITQTLERKFSATPVLVVSTTDPVNKFLFTTTTVNTVSVPCIQWDVPSASTAAIPAGKYDHDIRFVYAGSANAEYLFAGTVTISEAQST